MKKYVFLVKDPVTKAWKESFSETFEQAVNHKEFLYSIGYDVSNIEKVSK